MHTPHLLKVLLFLSLFTALSVKSQDVQFEKSDWENPAIFEINQVRPHAVIIPYASISNAISNSLDQCPFYVSLNGIWKFKWVENPDRVPQNFYKPDYDSENWDIITVPSDWQMQGYGHPKFRNIHLTFPSNPPFIPKEYNPIGCYLKTFDLPVEWQNREIFLRFEGVKSASYVWINGRRVGYNQGGFEPAEYDITRYLIKGKNHIAVQVLRYCDGSYLENQDMWRLSGIYRSVYLFAAPDVHIRDYYITTDFDEQYQNALYKHSCKPQLHISLSILSNSS